MDWLFCSRDGQEYVVCKKPIELSRDLAKRESVHGHVDFFRETHSRPGIAAGLLVAFAGAAIFVNHINAATSLTFFALNVASAVTATGHNRFFPYHRSAARSRGT